MPCVGSCVRPPVRAEAPVPKRSPKLPASQAIHDHGLLEHSGGTPGGMSLGHSEPKPLGSLCFSGYGTYVLGIARQPRIRSAKPKPARRLSPAL